MPVTSKPPPTDFSDNFFTDPASTVRTASQIQLQSFIILQRSFCIRYSDEQRQFYFRCFYKEP